AVHRVESVRAAKEIGRGLRRAADAGKLRYPVRRQVQLEERLDDRRADRVVAAARAQRRDRAFVVAMGEAERIHRQRGMMELRLDDVGHDTTLRSGVIFSASRCSAIARTMKRAVIGVPSKCSTGTRRTGSRLNSLTSSRR